MYDNNSIKTRREKWKHATVSFLCNMWSGVISLEGRWDLNMRTINPVAATKILKQKMLSIRQQKRWKNHKKYAIQKKAERGLQNYKEPMRQIENNQQNDRHKPNHVNKPIQCKWSVHTIKRQ